MKYDLFGVYNEKRKWLKTMFVGKGALGSVLTGGPKWADRPVLAHKRAVGMMLAGKWTEGHVLRAVQGAHFSVERGRRQGVADVIVAGLWFSKVVHFVLPAILAPQMKLYRRGLCARGGKRALD